MLKRLVRVIIGAAIILTSPITFVPSLVVWVLTDRFYLIELLDWCLLGDERY